MYKKTMTFEDFNGQSITEDFYFHLTKADLVEMNIASLSDTNSQGFDGLLRHIIATTDGKEIARVFRELILKSVGKKSPDGRRFIKNDEIREDFAATNAYSDLYTSLSSDDGAAAEFVNGLMPNDLKASVEKSEPVKLTIPVPPAVKNDNLEGWSAEELQAALRNATH